MDLVSIKCLEVALSKTPSALVSVSNDKTFPDSLIKTEWKIGKITGVYCVFNINIKKPGQA